MPNIGPTELIIILVLALLVFGPKRLPEMGRNIGRGLREFRKAKDEVTGSLDLSGEAKRAASADGDVRPDAADTDEVLHGEVVDDSSRVAHSA